MPMETVHWSERHLYSNIDRRQMDGKGCSRWSLPLSPYWGALPPPYPTGAWWSNLVLGEGRMPVVALPYAVALRRLLWPSHNHECPNVVVYQRAV